MRLRARRPGVAALRSVVDRTAYVRPVERPRVSPVGRELPVGEEPAPVGAEPAPVGAEPLASVGAEPVGPEPRDGRSISGAATAVTAVTGRDASTGPALATLPHTVQ
jgi:hypothetical protein